MNRLFLSCFLLLCVVISFNAYSQVCTPDPGCNTTQLICPSTLSAGCEGEAYSQTITVALGGSVQGITIVDVTLSSVTGLPPGMNYDCNPTGCVFIANSSSCILISGTPTASGTFAVRASLLVDIGLTTIPIDTSFGSIVIYPACDDGDSCTIDACDGSGGCIYTPLNCDDGDPCTNDVCISGCQNIAINCDDGDSCTADACDSGVCFNTAIPGCGVPCTPPSLSFDYENTCVGDTAFVTNNSTGIDPAGTFYIDRDSDGSIDETFPAAAFPAGTSQAIPIAGNLNFTIIAENPGGCSDTFEVIIIGVVCDDADACTSDTCAGGTCSNFPINCTDADACNGIETCDTVLGCVNGTPLVCDDANACNGTETCHPLLGCQAGTPLICDDADSCTVDFCDIATGCSNTFDSLLCAITNPCDTLNCDDSNACTSDTCTGGTCSNFAINCTDADACNGIETCDTVLGCVNGTPLICDDADACNGVETCHPLLGCHAGTPIECADSNACTSDVCNAGVCNYFPVNCTDADACNGIETCDTVLGCVNGTPLVCDDNDSCTVDSCHPLLGCVFTPVVCDDGDSCTIDICDNGICIYTGSCCTSNADCEDNDVCTDDVCDNGSCLNTPINCDDGYSCTDDLCVNGVCEHLPICCLVAADCDDGDPCTRDKCINGICSRTPLNCDDNDPCTTDNCDGNGGCINAAINCDDGDPCTADICDSGQCQNTPLNCDDSDPCTVDTCDSGTCVNTAINCDDGDSCTTDVCVNGSCVNTRTCCVSVADCDDNSLCTLDSCNNSLCSNTQLDCDDNYSCTDDFCVNGACQHLAICCTVDADCDDGDGCTTDDCRNGVCSRTPSDCDDNDACTTDSCDAGVGCINASLNCDDGDSCTTDRCDNGVCVYDVLCCSVNSDCDDNDLCTTDSCNNALCLNTSLNCDDGDSCTLDLCDNGVCVNEGSCCASTADCYDGDLCTIDSCTNGICVSEVRCDDGDPCTDDYCRVYYNDDDDDGHGSRHYYGSGNYDEDDDCYHDDDDDGWYDDDDDGGFRVVCYNVPKDCREGDRCTTDYCDNGQCFHTPINCDDGDSCTTDFCLNGWCKHSQTCCIAHIDCNDGDVCTTDSCINGICVNTPKDCSDGDACTIDVCDRYTHHGNSSARCKHSLIDCREGNPCTVDYCDSIGACVHDTIPGCCVTDADCDDNDACTNERCYRSVCKYTPALNDLTIVEVSDFCQGNGVQLKVESSSAVSYSWSTGDTTDAIRASADSTYSVTVTDVNGCQDSATHSISDASEILSSFVIIADEQVSLYNNTVFSGGVGAKDNDGDVKLKNGTTVTAAGTFVKADDIYVSGSSSASTLISTPANVTLPAFESNPYSGGSTVNVPNNSTITLNGSIYGDVYIGSNCTVIFTQPDLYVRNLNVGDNSTVRFAECTRLHVKNDMKLGRNNNFNPDAFDVVVFVEDDVNINRSSTVTADIYVRDGSLSIRKGTATSPNIMTGLFIAERVTAKDYTYWYTNASCNDTCPANVQPLIVMKNSGSENTGIIASEVTSALPAATETKLKAYPNPFTEKLNIEFTLPEDSKATLEVFNLAGQRLAVVFDGNVKANQLHKTEFTPQNISEGIIIYRLQTTRGTYYDKAVLVR